MRERKLRDFLQGVAYLSMHLKRRSREFYCVCKAMLDFLYGKLSMLLLFKEILVLGP